MQIETTKPLDYGVNALSNGGWWQGWWLRGDSSLLLWCGGGELATTTRHRLDFGGHTKR